MRGAIVGFGFIMENGHFSAYRQRAERAQAEGHAPDVEIVALADVCRDRRELAARLSPGLRTYADYLEPRPGTWISWTSPRRLPSTRRWRGRP
jgi:predicted dehydrogenase